MSHDDFKPKLGRIRDSGQLHKLRHRTRVLRQAGKSGFRALRQRGHICSATPKRGMGAGDLGAARADLKYILRDGVTREGASGKHYDRSHDDADGSDFLDRSEQDPHQFRFIVSPEDSARLPDLKPFIRDSPRWSAMSSLRRQETGRIADSLSRQLNAVYFPHEAGSRISGVYERVVTTPTTKLAVIRREDTFTLAPWKPALEPMRGRMVTSFIGPNRVARTLDRGRALSGRS